MTPFSRWWFISSTSFICESFEHCWPRQFNPGVTSARTHTKCLAVTFACDRRMK